MDGQEAVTMDERPSVPRWWGREKQETEASLLGGQELAGWQAGGLDARNLRGLFDSKEPSWEPFPNIDPAHLRGGARSPKCDKNVALKHHCWSPGLAGQPDCRGLSVE